MRKQKAMPLRMDKNKFAERLARRFGSTEKLAAELKVPGWRVHAWAYGGDIFPEQLFAVARALRCQMHDLLPD